MARASAISSFSRASVTAHRRMMPKSSFVVPARVFRLVGCRVSSNHDCQVARLASSFPVWQRRVSIGLCRSLGRSFAFIVSSKWIGGNSRVATVFHSTRELPRAVPLKFILASCATAASVGGCSASRNQGVLCMAHHLCVS